MKPAKPARYKLGDEVQLKRSNGVRRVVQIETYQFRWHPPEPVYVLDDGSHVFDYQLH